MGQGEGRRCLLPFSVLNLMEQHPYAAKARAQLERIATGWRLKWAAGTRTVNIGAQTKDEILGEKMFGEAELEPAR